MDTNRASIAQAKNALSSLIDKVAYGKTRVVLESRDKPKAALISTDDLEKLERLEREEKGPEARLHFLTQAQALRRQNSSAHREQLFSPFAGRSLNYCFTIPFLQDRRQGPNRMRIDLQWRNSETW
jgi:prevent-host-death family protein